MGNSEDKLSKCFKLARNEVGAMLGVWCVRSYLATVEVEVEVLLAGEQSKAV